jgi:hypothetical protein
LEKAKEYPGVIALLENAKAGDGGPAAELPGAANSEGASEVSIDWAAGARAALASIKAEKAALEDGNEHTAGRPTGHPGQPRPYGHDR